MSAGNSERGWLSLGVHVAALISATMALALTGLSDHLPAWANALVALLMVGGPFVGATLAVGRGAGSLRVSFVRGARELSPGTAWLIPAPLMASLGRVTAEPLMALCFLAGVACLALTRGHKGTEALPWLFRPRRGERLDAWAWGLLALCAGALTLNLAVGPTLAFPQDNDAAYYFGVARHIVETGRFEEPLVWHFLTKPPTLLHPPFDYWQPLTSFVLIPPMRVFGPSYRVAVTTMIVLMGVGLVLLWHLVVVLRLVRTPLVQATVLLLFAFSPALRSFGFDTESIPVLIVLFVAAVWALWARRSSLVLVLGGLMILTRSDAVFAAGALWVAALLEALRGGAGARLRLRRLGVVFVAVVTAYVAFNLTIHESPLPPGGRVAVRLGHYTELYLFDRTSAPLSRLLPQRLELPYIGERLKAAWTNLLDIDFVPARAFWWGPIFVAGLLIRDAQRRVRVVVWAISFGGSAAVSWWAPGVFASWRTLYVMLPLVLIAGALAVEALLSRAGSWVGRSRAGRRGPAVLSVLLLLLLGVPLKELHVRQLRQPATPLEHEALVAFKSTLKGAPVATTRPWLTIASTDSPAVSLPQDGAGAIETVLRRYQVGYVILGGEACGGASKVVCENLLSGATNELGGIELEHVRTHGKFKLFRVLD